MEALLALIRSRWPRVAAAMALVVLAFAVLDWVVGAGKNVATVCQWVHLCAPPPIPDPKLVVAKQYRVYFDFDKSNLTAEADAVVDEIVKELRENPDYIVRLQGFSDTEGYDDEPISPEDRDRYMLALASRRTNTVH